MIWSHLPNPGIVARFGSNDIFCLDLEGRGLECRRASIISSFSGTSSHHTAKWECSPDTFDSCRGCCLVTNAFFSNFFLLLLRRTTHQGGRWKMLVSLRPVLLQGLWLDLADTFLGVQLPPNMTSLLGNGHFFPSRLPAFLQRPLRWTFKFKSFSLPPLAAYHLWLVANHGKEGAAGCHTSRRARRACHH